MEPGPAGARDLVPATVWYKGRRVIRCQKVEGRKGMMEEDKDEAG